MQVSKITQQHSYSKCYTAKIKGDMMIGIFQVYLGQPWVSWNDKFLQKHRPLPEHCILQPGRPFWHPTNSIKALV